MPPPVVALYATRTLSFYANLIIHFSGSLQTGHVPKGEFLASCDFLVNRHRLTLINDAIAVGNLVYIWNSSGRILPPGLSTVKYFDLTNQLRDAWGRIIGPFEVGVNVV